MKEKKGRTPLLDKVEGKAMNAPGKGAKSALTAADVYRDVNNALGQLYRMLLGFFDIKVPKSVARAGRARAKPKKRKGWF